MGKVINYIEVPATEQDDINRGKTTWKEGKCVMMDEGAHATLYLGHRTETVYDDAPDGVTASREAVFAFAVRVAKPLSKASAINAAEMQAYAWDLETNAQSVQNFTNPHIREVGGKAKVLTSQRDIYEINANMGARRLRSRILAILPTDLVDMAIEVFNNQALVGIKQLARHI